MSDGTDEAPGGAIAPVAGLAPVTGASAELAGPATAGEDITHCLSASCAGTTTAATSGGRSFASIRGNTKYTAAAVAVISPNRTQGQRLGRIGS
jgi:hypothetical protein